MKKIDFYILKSFLPPFFVAFMIAIFVLLMQALWLYIDDIVGKGLGFFQVMELLSYKLVGLVPLALPIAVLISSVMVMGNLGEKYELSSLNSAGISLIRIMAPVIGFGVFAAGFSFFCADYVIPRANLKFGSRMYDISKQKPTLRLDAGVFNYDFHGYAIHIGEKDPDGVSIKDVIIYDHSYKSQGQFKQITAKEGIMFTSEDGNYFVMRLKDAHQYVEARPRRAVGPERDYPFVRTSFKEWEKLFDLSEFELNSTDEEMFKHNRSMMSTAQLVVAIDSISDKIFRREVTFSNYLSTYFRTVNLDSTYLMEEKLEAKDKRELMGDEFEGEPSAKLVKLNKTPTPNRVRGGFPIEQDLGNIASTGYFVTGFPKHERAKLINKAKSFGRSIKNRSLADSHYLRDVKVSRVKFTYDMTAKYGMAVVCFIFVFIGAPLGAIVRKGGFGYPILISILVFVLFVILMIFFRKIGESFIIPADLAAWMPSIIVFPIGVYLTYRAMNNSRLY